MLLRTFSLLRIFHRFLPFTTFKNPLPLFLTHPVPRTHGTHRPFLPSLIRQNADEAVKSATGSAFSSIPPSSTGRPTKQPYPEAALTSLTKALKGVGPATATLLLSVHDPDGTPFFSDELYAWLVDGAAGPPRSKLKYDAKEYRRLYEAWVEFRRRAIQDKEEGGVRAVDVEKAAFVLGHWEFLDGDERRRAAGMERGDEDAAGGEREDGVPRAPAAAGKAKRKKASEPVGRPGKETDAANGQRQLRDNDDDDDDDDEDGIRIRRSKRSRNVK